MVLRNRKKKKKIAIKRERERKIARDRGSGERETGEDCKIFIFITYVPARIHQFRNYFYNSKDRESGESEIREAKSARPGKRLNYLFVLRTYVYPSNPKLFLYLALLLICLSGHMIN